MAKDANELDAVALLKADHRTVEGLFESFKKASGARKASIAKNICEELIVHSTIEEEIFYPAIRGKVEDDLLDESYVEHDGAKLLIAEIMDGRPDDDFYDAKVTVLSEMIQHHVKEEEKPAEGLFAQARKAEVDLDALGALMQKRKDEAKAEVARDGAAKLETRTFTGGTVPHGRPPEFTAMKAAG
jgi:hypothetical protein